MNPYPTTEARSRFFSEDTDLEHPFRTSSWRGCVLDRDKYDNTRLPEILWRALVFASSTSVVTVCGYYDERVERCIRVDASWSSFSQFMRSTREYSPEYVIFDQSGEWAISADMEVTTVGLQSKLADAVDSILSESNLSLLALTCRDFSSEGILSPRGAYIRSVLGGRVVAQLLAETRR